jgi:hypothetical protein
MAGTLATMADSDAEYRRLGLSPTSIETWEDGARTDNSTGTYEWWYFDAHLADGAKLVLVFANKDITDPKRPLSPQLRLNLDLSDGRHFEKIVPYPAGEWSSAKDHCDVRMGENRFFGDLHHYRIEVRAEGISIEVTLDGEVPPWRPSTGYMLFGTDRALEFAWLPSVPQGAASVTYTIDGERHETTGVGYHDHNWGNVALMKIVHDWYWARGQAGPYSVIASYITAAEKFDFEPIPIFMLARGKVLIGDDPANVSFERESIYTDETTGKPVAGTTRYTYRDGDERYVVAFTRSHDLSADRMIDGVKGIKRIAAKLAHFDGAYLRFVGEVEISRFRADEVLETHKDEAIWELMYFGHAMQVQ